MSANQNNFLDRTSLIALVLLGVSWILWDTHMRQKYPKTEAKAPVEKVETKTSTKSKSSIFTSQNLREKTLSHDGDSWNLVLSSQGMGFSRIELKKYLDQDKKPLEFIGSPEPLFASYIGDKILPFKIQKTKQGFAGVYAAKDFYIVKNIDLDENNYVFKTSVKLVKFPKNLASLGIFVPQGLKQSKTKN